MLLTREALEQLLLLVDLSWLCGGVFEDCAVLDSGHVCAHHLLVTRALPAVDRLCGMNVLSVLRKVNHLTRLRGRARVARGDADVHIELVST